MCKECVKAEARAHLAERGGNTARADTLWQRASQQQDFCGQPLDWRAVQRLLDKIRN